MGGKSLKEHVKGTQGSQTDSRMGPTVESSLVQYQFESILRLLTFGIAVWLAGKTCEAVFIPSLVGEILMGATLGPSCLAFVPIATALMMLGEVGIILLVIEAGLHVDRAVLWRIGWVGVCMGVCGCLFSLLCGFGLASSQAGITLRTALAVGACFAPTSFGIAMTVMKPYRVLHTPLGQLIVTAAVVDDVLALVILSELKVLGSAGAKGIDFAAPIISAAAFSCALVPFALLAMPSCAAWIVKILGAGPRADNLLLGLLLLLSFGLAGCLEEGRCSHLFGAFLGGLSFSTVPKARALWRQQISRILKWLMRLFFSATIAFPLPIASLWTAEVVSLALLLFCAVAGKVALGCFARPWSAENFGIVAASMALWGDFSFLVAKVGRQQVCHFMLILACR